MRTLFPAILAAAAFAAVTPPALAVPPAPGQQLLEWCVLNSGEMIEQPPGSPILVCCVEGEGCIMCDTNWENCEFDPPYGLQPGRANGIDPLDLFAAPSQPAPPGLVAPQQRVQ
jgi:hypothetical protein